jgi:hypothetical protein
VRSLGLVIVMPKLEHRRQARLYPRSSPRSLAEGALHEGSREAFQAHSGIGQSRGCSFFESVAEVGETHLSGRGHSRGNSREQRLDSLG